MTSVWLGIDGTNWIHALWHAMASAKPEQVIDAAARRLAAVVDWIESPDRRQGWTLGPVVICWDRRSFRHDLDPKYKANRPPKLSALVDTLCAAETELGKHALAAKVDGCEADDLLATLATYGVLQGANVILCSPDHDVRQCLVQSRVSILTKYTVTKGRLTANTTDWYTALHLHTDHQLQPWQWPDYQALVGESGDNVAGCPGIGPKTAAAMLVKCGSLAKILNNPWAAPCTDRQRRSLFAWKSQADRALQLVTLRTDVQELWDSLR